MSIAVVTVAIGDHQRFLDEWLASVGALERTPDEVIVIADGEFTPSRFNEAVERTSTEWVCKLDVDDVIFPHALNRIDEWQADVAIFGVRYGDNTWQPDGQFILTVPDNPVSAASPFRRKVWEYGPYRDMPYWDWVFWIEAANNGFVFDRTGTIDYEHRLHDGQVTANGDHEARAAEVLRWREELLCESS